MKAGRAQWDGRAEVEDCARLVEISYTAERWTRRGAFWHLVNTQLATTQT